MLKAASQGFTRALVSWVDAVGRAAWWVVIAAIGVTAVLVYYTAANLAVNTDTADMISRELPFRQRYEDYKRAFPQFVDTFLVVVEGDTPDRAEDAAVALSARLRRETSLFKSVNVPAGDPFFVRNGLLYLDSDDLADVADRLAEAEPLLATLAEDPSLRGLFDVLGLAVDDILEGGDVPAGLPDVFGRIAAVVDSLVAGRPRPLSWYELMTGETAEPNDRRRFILVQPVLDYASLEPASAPMSAVRHFARELGLDEDRGVRVRLTGGAALATEELRSVSEGAVLAGSVSLLLVSALLLVGLRSGRLVIATLITLVMGLIWTAGFATLAIGSLNLVSVAFAVLFIALGVDFGIHFGLRYKEEIDRGTDHAEALRNAAMGVGDALTLCAIAAAIGFFSFVPTAYAGLSELGIISGTGMFFALFASLTVLPALLTLMPLRSANPVAPARPRSEMFIRRHVRPILAVALVLGVGAAVLAPLVRFDFNPLNLKDPKAESVRTFLDLLRDSRTAPYTIEILTEDLDAAAELAERLEGLAEVDRAVTLMSYLPSEQGEKLDVIEGLALFLMPLLGDAAAMDPPSVGGRRVELAAFRARLDALIALPTAGPIAVSARRLADVLDRFETAAGDRPQALAELESALLTFLPGRLERLRRALLAGPVGLDDLPRDLRARYIAADDRARVEVFPEQDISDNKVLSDFVAAVRTVAPDATDSPVLIVEAADAVVGAMRQATITAAVLITALLLMVLRSLRDALLVLLPLALAALLTVAASVLLDLPFNFANVVVLPLLMGLGVASGIHLVMRARVEADDVALLRTSTPRAVVLSALTTIASFGSLALSSHRGTASMGELLTIAIGFTLICTLIVLPALMALLGPRTKGQAA
ncbi:MAG: MMPL family transporter [Alphaproteobacteria bacterium]